jgi:hypothetical protein
MKLELEHAGGVRELALTKLPTQVDIIEYRAKEARWPDPVEIGLAADATPEQFLSWLTENREAYARMVERSAVVLPDQLRWLQRFLSPDDARWLEDYCVPHVVARVCAAIVATREVPAEAAKKFSLRPLS